MNKPAYDKEHMQKLADQVFKKAWKKDFPFEAERTRHLVQQHDLVGVLIKKAMEQGEFDNLEGTGQPLNLGDNPFVPDDMHMAYKILKDAGYAPYWIELGKEIDALRVKLNKEVDDFNKYSQMVFTQKRSSGAVYRYKQKKSHFYTQIREYLEQISKKILDYNLHCPLSLGRISINVDDEMSRIVQDIEKISN